MLITGDMGMIQTAQNGRKCHALLIYRRMIPSVRLCGYSQLRALDALGRIEYRAVRDRRLRRSDLEWADVAFLGRLDNWYERRIVTALHASGRRLVYIMDDDLLNLPPQISSAAYLGQPAIQDNIRAMVEMSDAILSPSPILLEKYAEDGRLPMRTEEPALEPARFRPHAAGRPVKIGFAGSVDRTSDLEKLLREALLGVRRRYGDRVAFEFFGATPDFAEELGATCVPYLESYIDYRRQLNALEWDIGLAPMPDTPFHACKHYNKFCEYAAAGVAGIYSDLPPYTFIPQREIYGRFCKNEAGAWYDALCAEIDDDAGREARRRRLSVFAATELSPETIGLALFEAHPEIFVPCACARIQALPMPLLKTGNALNQAVEKSRRYGLRLPGVVIQKLSAAMRATREKL